MIDPASLSELRRGRPGFVLINDIGTTPRQAGQGFKNEDLTLMG